jgi:hypothetical protein
MSAETEIAFEHVSFRDLKKIAGRDCSFAGGSLRELEGFQAYIGAKILTWTEVCDDGGPATVRAVKVFSKCSYSYMNDAHNAENTLLRLTKQESSPFHLHAHSNLITDRPGFVYVLHDVKM